MRVPRGCARELPGQAGKWTLGWRPGGPGCCGSDAQGEGYVFAARGTQFTCFTGTKVQDLTPEEQAVAPAIRRARAGFPMYEHLYDRITTAAARLKYFDASVGLFLKDDRKTPRVAVGETFANPDLAKTLERLASHGVEDFYSGLLADEIVAGAHQFTTQFTCFTSTQVQILTQLFGPPGRRDCRRQAYTYTRYTYTRDKRTNTEYKH